MSGPLKQKIGPLVRQAGFERFGLTPLGRPQSIDKYKKWLDKGFAGDMDYLTTHFPQKCDPKLLLSQAKSAIVVSVDYLPHPQPQSNKPLPKLKTALYAHGKDYHQFLKAQLELLISLLRQEFPKDSFLAMTDSAPVLERDLAHRAGLGWIGKNTCLIHQKHGSLFFIGEIYTSLEIDAPPPIHPSMCGSCTRCIDACPTQAILADRELDARRCIAYLNIESRTVAPVELRKKIGDWFFGCDICQTVCPWNEKHHGQDLKRQYEQPPRRQQILADIRHILTSSNKKLQRLWTDTPLSRAGANGLKRNAIIIAANLNLHEVLPEIKALKNSPRLAEIAAWAIQEIS